MGPGSGFVGSHFSGFLEKFVSGHLDFQVPFLAFLALGVFEFLMGGAGLLPLIPS